MATKKVKKRVSNGISQFHGNKHLKEGSKSASKARASEQKLSEKQKGVTEAKQQASAAPLVITVTRHHHPALKSMFGSHAFYTADGRELRNLLDLAHAFEEMTEDTFRHHVGEAHNHFSNWLKDCFQLEQLAESIKSSTKMDAHAKVLKHVLHELLK